MVIGIDANEANLTTQRVGVGQYAYNIITELHRQDKANQYHIYLKQPPLPDMPAPRSNWVYHVFGPQKLWSKIALPFRLFTQSLHLDFFYSPNHYSPHFSPCPSIPTIHDLGYLQTLDQFNQKDIYQLVNWTRHSIIKAHHIIAVSEFTKSEINRIYNIPLQKISVITNGVGKIPNYSVNQTKKVLRRLNITSSFFLTLGTLKPNKNIPFLLTAFSKTTNHLLVIAGKKGWQYDQIFSLVKQLHLESRVIFTDYITQDEKWILLKNAVVTVLPSTYEGFGIPAIESLYAGTSVIASDIPAYREILSQEVVFINPFQESDLIKALNQFKTKKKVKVNKRYTWSNSAKTLINLFSRI